MDAWLFVLALIGLGIPLALLVALLLIFGLRRRVQVLERTVLALQAERPDAATAHRYDLSTTQPMQEPAPVVEHPLATSVPPTARATASETEAVTQPVTMPAPPPLPAMAAPTNPPNQPTAVGAFAERAERVSPEAAEPPPPGPLERWIDAGKRWFTEGNVPVKIGMLVLLAGVAALLKYVSDQGLLEFPIELRLAAITAGAMGLLAVGWRQREPRRLFALALQGGAIGVLMLTVFAASKRYALLPDAAAFIITIALVAGLCVLSVVQNSRTLAVLGVLSGFMAPIWLSTGSGNHVALFSYYAVLNAGIFLIAWKRSWRVLNLLGFAFTFGIGIVWGVLQYRPEDASSTQPFLLLFFLFYLAIPILQSHRALAGSASGDERARYDFIDGSLVFGTPLVAFSLQAAMLRGQPMPLALLAVAVGALYAVLALWQRRRGGSETLLQAHAVLAAGFATLAVPLALSARATGAVFALEGAGLAWLGVRQRRWLPQLSGGLLQLASAAAFALGADDWNSDTTAVFNGTAMGALLLALAGLASALAYRQRAPLGVAGVYYVWGLLWWLGGLCHEVLRFAPEANRADVLLMGVAVTVLLAAQAQRRWPAPALPLTVLVMVLAAFALVPWQIDAHQQPLQGLGAVAWAVMLLLGLRALFVLRTGGGTVAVLAQACWWLLWPFVLSASAAWLADHQQLASGWRYLLLVLPWWALAALGVWRWPLLRQPLGAGFDAAKAPLRALLAAVLGAAWWWGLGLAASAAPLPWLPLVNPAELMQWAIIALAAVWLQGPDASPAVRQARLPVLALLCFVGLSSTVLHVVHHWGAVAWTPQALWSSSLAQTSVAVLWSALGVVAWVLGSRRQQRLLWTVGAVLMAVVLAKLVLVDRQHLGNLLGIASFIAYGLLCTVVGYLAPAPPKAAQDVEE